jgi:hypothetical protein
MPSNLKKMLRVAREHSQITPKLTGWLANHGEGVVVEHPEAAELLIELATRGGSRAEAFHPSQLYRCQREQVFGYFGVEQLKWFNPTLQNIFNDGTWRHIRWQLMLMNAGILSRVEVKVAMPEYRLVGSMDGVNDEQGWMFELKGTSQFSTIKKSGVMPAHVKQVQAYLMAAGLDKAVVIYENKSNQEWAEFEVHQDEQTVKEVTEILGLLNHAIDHGELPEVQDECKSGKGAAFNNCSYSHICRQARTGEQAVELSTTL